MRLLVVDDDSSVRETLNEVFKDVSDVELAENAEDATELIKKNEYSSWKSMI